MKVLQKQRLTIQKGKIQGIIDIEGPRPVNDNVADELLTQAEQFNPKGIEGIRTIELWKEVAKSETIQKGVIEEHKSKSK
jgi:hypothetical protein